MRGRPHSDETKAAVMAALLAGMSIAEVSRQYSLPKSTINSIKKELSPEQFAQVRTETRTRLDDLLLDALAANLEAQKRIVITASEPEYLRKQTISAIAEFYETISDKAIRLLEAASFGDGEQPEAEGETETAAQLS